MSNSMNPQRRSSITLHSFTSICAMVALIVTASGCSDDDPDKPGKVDDGNSATLTASIKSTGETTSSYKTTFEDGDAIGVFVVVRDSDTEQKYPSATNNRLDNVKYIFQDGTWNPESANLGIKYTKNRKIDIYAYYPYQDSADPTGLNIDVSSAAEPVMTASALGLSDGTEPVVLEFTHRLSMLELELYGVPLEGQFEVTIPEKIKEITLDFTMEGIAAIAGSTLGDIKAGYANGLYYGYVPAQVIDNGKPLFTVVEGDKSFTYNNTELFSLTAGEVKRYGIRPDNLRPAKLPNTYFLKPGVTIYVPTAKAWGAWETDIILREAETPSTENLSAEIVWQDVQNMFLDEEIAIIGTGKDSYIKLTSDQSKGGGNAVVALKSGETVIWSWHIWVTDYDPDKDGRVYKFNGYTAMDRNLGAVSAEVSQVGTLGNQYMWGRKDPFPNADKLGDSENWDDVPIDTWNGKGEKVAISFDYSSPTGLENLTRSINDPYLFLFSVTEPYNWYSRNPESGESRLWNDEYGDKTVFDPCPGGWRVPASRDVFYGFDMSQPEYINGNLWREYGYWIGSGKRSGGVDMLNYAGIFGYYWTADTYLQSSYIMFIAPTETIITDSYRSDAFGVRCVRE